ncbi:MAG: hypothetical protein Q9221_000604 [Calogaya cf. arnoldii]
MALKKSRNTFALWNDFSLLNKLYNASGKIQRMGDRDLTIEGLQEEVRAQKRDHDFEIAQLAFELTTVEARVDQAYQEMIGMLNQYFIRRRSKSDTSRRKQQEHLRRLKTSISKCSEGKETPELDSAAQAVEELAKLRYYADYADYVASLCLCTTYWLGSNEVILVAVDVKALDGKTYKREGSYGKENDVTEKSL